MIIVFLILGILIAIIGWLFYNKDYDDVWIFVAGFGVFITISLIIALFMLINKVKEQDIIDKKIEMYQEENTNIENDIDILVKQYMEHEKITLKEFKPGSSITLVNLYPDLKSNELVQQQINIYTENNNKIKELKENKLDYQIYKWWLYFGKVSE